MEGINNWALTVTVCAVIVSIAGLLPRSKGTEKTVRAVLGAFMLCAVILPLGSGYIQGIDPLSGISTESFEQNNNMDEIAVDMIKKQIAKLIYGKLEEKGIIPSEIRVSVSVDDSGGIKAVSALIYLDSREYPKGADVCRRLENDLGIRLGLIHDR